MKIVCAWCGSVLKDNEEVRPISHGICAGCSRNLLFQGGVRLREYLNTLGAPVLAVDSDVVVKVANDLALAALGKDAAAVAERHGGVVFECEFARLPGGCGRTVHCSACAVRRTVTETFRTGKAQVRVPAVLHSESPRGKKEISLYISTEKVGEIVFLRIDRLEKKG